MEHAQKDLLPLALISLWASLNPCFDGKCSKRVLNSLKSLDRPLTVLILILMEHAQREIERCCIQGQPLDLNPYFNGTCSKRVLRAMMAATISIVLILFLMEHAQREYFL